MIRSTTPTAVLLLATAATAQTLPTIPVPLVQTEGNSVSLALARSGYQLTQTIYESRLVYRAVQSYGAIHLRPDAGFGSYALPAVTRHLTVRMSGAGVPSPELASQTSFAQNRGTDHTTVVNDRLITLPSVDQRPTPAPFTVAIPFDQPFPTLGIAHLLVELETRDEAAPVAGHWLADAEAFQAADWTILTSVHGTGCPTGGIGFGADVTVDPHAHRSVISTTFGMVRQPGQPPSHPALAIVGTDLRQWGPLPLPLPLDALGAPGCSIYTAPLATYAGVTSGGSAERFTWSLPIPREFGLLGQSLHAQSFLVDPLANAFGLRASPVATFTFSSPPDPHRALTLIGTTPGADRPTASQPNHAIVLGVQ